MQKAEHYKQVGISFELLGATGTKLVSVSYSLKLEQVQEDDSKYHDNEIIAVIAFR